MYIATRYTEAISLKNESQFTKLRRKIFLSRQSKKLYLNKQLKIKVSLLSLYIIDFHSYESFFIGKSASKYVYKLHLETLLSIRESSE